MLLRHCVAMAVMLCKDFFPTSEEFSFCSGSFFNCIPHQSNYETPEQTMHRINDWAVENKYIITKIESLDYKSEDEIVLKGRWLRVWYADETFACDPNAENPFLEPAGPPASTRVPLSSDKE